MTRKSASGLPAMKALIRKAAGQGWQVVRGGHGLKWKPPGDGPVIFSSATPSDHRAWRNHLSLMKKAGFHP